MDRVDAGSPWPWGVAALMLVAGFAAFRATWPLVARAWSAGERGSVAAR